MCAVDQRVTDALTEAAAAWVTLALQRLDERHLEAATACLEVDGADLQVVVRLCRGAIDLEGTVESAGKRTTLYREEVAPLRPRTSFAPPESDKKY